MAGCYHISFAFESVINSLGKTWRLGKIERKKKRGQHGWDGYTASRTQWIWIWTNSGRQWRTEELVHGVQRVGHDLATEQQQHNLCYKALFTHSCTVSKEETVKIRYYFLEKCSLNTNFNSRLIMRWIQVHLSIMKCITSSFYYI